MFVRLSGGDIVNLATAAHIRPAGDRRAVEIVFAGDQGNMVISGEPDDLLDALARITSAKTLADFTTEGSPNGEGSGSDDRGSSGRGRGRARTGSQSGARSRTGG